MKKYFTLPSFFLAQLVCLCLAAQTSFATAWSTWIKGDITNLHNWTNGTSSPTSFTTPGDTWAISDTMTISSPLWTVGTSGMAPSTVTFAVGGVLIDTTPAATPVITIYGNLVANGGTYTITRDGANAVVNVHGNALITNGFFTAAGKDAHLTFNNHGNFTMTGGAITTTGDSSVNELNCYGNCSLSGLSLMSSTGVGATGSVHFTLPSTSGTMLIDNGSFGAWAGMDFYIDAACTAQLDGNFTTNTGTIANGLTVNGRLICPAADSVTGSNSFNLNAGGALIVGHANGIDGPIVNTGLRTFSAYATYGFNGSSPQVTGASMPGALFSPDTIIISNPSGVTLSKSTGTTGVLEFIAGKLYTDTCSFTIPGHAPWVIGAGATKYVVGTLTKTISGDTVVNYEVGDSSYAPMTLKFDSVGTAGSISVLANYGLHPAAGSSTLSISHMVNHYWTVSADTPAGPTKVFVKGTYDLADIIGGSNALFMTQIYDGSLWLMSPLPSANTSSPYTTTTDTSIALGTLPGDYIFGQWPGVLNIKTPSEKPELRIFPNPNSGSFTLNLLSADNEEVQILVTNMLGEKIEEFTTPSNKPVGIVLEHAGVYLVSASTQHGTLTAMVVVQ